MVDRESGLDVIVTIGPRSWDESVVRRLLQLGVSAFRFPFAKETPEIHARNCELVRSVALQEDRQVRLFADLPGGKPRLSNSFPIQIEDREYCVGMNSTIEAVDLYVDPPLTCEDLAAGSEVTIGDGENDFLVEMSSHHSLRGRFARKGLLERRRGFLPRMPGLEISCFTDGDRSFAVDAANVAFDWVALSFVSSAPAIVSARAWLSENCHWQPEIVAKVENRRAVERIEEIVEVADRILIGRGDLLNTVGARDLLNSQRRVIEASRAKGKYCIVATGFLTGFAVDGVTRQSESIDIRLAVEMGADAIMLSAETTIGERPVESVELLRKIAS